MASRQNFSLCLLTRPTLAWPQVFQPRLKRGDSYIKLCRTRPKQHKARFCNGCANVGIEHRSFYIVNAILVKGTREIAEALAARPDVARVEGNPHIQNELPQPGPSVERAFVPPASGDDRAGNQLHARAAGLGAWVHRAENRCCSADTGVRWTHNALKPHYRGWDGQNANHDYNWHDSIHDSVGNPCGNDSPFPCDDFFHGTHTTGTAIGDDGAGNQIGMAPGAKWIGCRNMDQGNGTPARYIECMEFFLAPYPIARAEQGDPTKAPDITNNSWGCPPSEGCSANTLQAAVEAQGAAGIMMVVAAGNGGSACSTVSDPPGIYAESYSVGALTTGTDTIAGFSSRGPVTLMEATASNPISLLRVLTLARLITPVILVIPLPAARRWPLRTSLAQWHCCGRRFRACKTRSTRVATL